MASDGSSRKTSAQGLWILASVVQAPLKLIHCLIPACIMSRVGYNKQSQGGLEGPCRRPGRLQASGGQMERAAVRRCSRAGSQFIIIA